MSSKKVFNIKDKVFAKIRGYPAWPAIISSVKADTPSRMRYNVYFYGTGERAECKPEELFQYEENKAKLGKPSKRKYFAEALLEIEEDDNGSYIPENSFSVAIPPSNTEQKSPQPLDESETEKVGESNSETEGKLSNEDTSTPKKKKVSTSKKSLGISITKGTKRKLSDHKSETSLKKSAQNKIKISESGDIKNKDNVIVNDETLNNSSLVTEIVKQDTVTLDNNSFVQTPEKTKPSENNTTKSVSESTDVSMPLDNSKTKSSSKIKNSTSVEISSSKIKNSSSVVEVSSSKIKNSPSVVEISSLKIKNSPSVVEVSSSKIKNSPSIVEVSSSKIKNSPSVAEVSSNSSNVGHVSRSGRKIKPKKYSDYENDGEIPKRSRVSKESVKTTEKVVSTETENVSELDLNTKDTSTNTEIRKTSKNNMSKFINDSSTNEITKVNKSIIEDGELPVTLKGLMNNAISNIEADWEKTLPMKKTKIEMLHTEVALLDCIHKLRLALRTDCANCESAIELLEQVNQLELINAFMLTKHTEVVDTIRKISKYVGNPNEWELDEQATIKHFEKAKQVRAKADAVFNKFVTLFIVPDGKTFQDVFDKEVEDFNKKTKNLPSDQIYGLTSDTLF